MHLVPLSRRPLTWGLLSLVTALNLLLVGPALHEPTEEEIIDGYHELFYRSGSTWKRNRWLGVPAHQNPNDVWITQEIITEVAPDVIVETGSMMGGSAVLWAMILEDVNPEGRVLTIDIEPPEAKAARDPALAAHWAVKAAELPVAERRVEFLLGSSTSEEIVERVRAACEGKKVLVILDSWHDGDHVLQELRLYAPLVGVGSYVIVQDTNVNGHPVLESHGRGPWEAVSDFLAEDDDFVVDRYRERLLFTMHPRGYLKRVR